MTPKREALIKRAKDIGKDLPAMKTYNEKGRLVLSRIENKNETTLILEEAVKLANPKIVSNFKKLLMKKEQEKKMTTNIKRKIKNALILEHGKNTIISEQDIEDIEEYLKIGKDFSLEAISQVAENMTRKCSKCNSVMFEGYVENDGDAHYCSKTCLLNEFDSEEKFFGTVEEQEEFEEKGYGNPNYWTNWGLSEETEV